MKAILSKATLAGLAVLCITAQFSRAEIVYDNTSTDTGNRLLMTNGWTIGNEIILGNNLPGATITNFSFEIYSSQSAFIGANVQMQVYLFANNGAAFNGYSSPGTTLYNSGLFSLPTPYQFTSGASHGGTVQFDLTSSPVTINATNFTFAAYVSGLDAADMLGFELFSGGTVGQSYGDYWAYDGTSWSLKTGAVPTIIGAQFQATAVPEPSTLALVGLGAGLLMALRRRSA